jgi:2-haloacid dehalogenase
MPVTAIAFDVNETLFSLDVLGRRIEKAGLPAESLPIWFTRVLRDGFALTATRDYRPFRDLAATHLAAVLRAAGLDDGDDAVAAIFSAFSELDPHPDVEPALRRLRQAGVPAVTLTNGHADTTRALLDRAGLGDLVVDCLSVDDVGIWKPAAAPYLHAASVLDLAPGDLAMIAVHSWDIHGAKRAGLRAGYCPRLEGAFVEGFATPDVTGADLVAVVEGLIRV